MEKRIYAHPTVQEHEVETDGLLIYVGSDEKTDQQLSKPREAPGEKAAEEYGNLW